MKQRLHNPVFEALTGKDGHLGFGTGKAKAFDEEVSPFAGFEEGYQNGFSDLYELLPSGRRILYATPLSLAIQKGWSLRQKVEGLQFVFDATHKLESSSLVPAPLNETHVDEMMQLATLTKPGPFGPRTIAFGHYFGFFEAGRLVAMTGQRLHAQEFTEISAVCTHPDCLGKGYASALVRHQVALILDQGQTPFLHVREDNLRAIDVYRRLGFSVSGNMNFYFMKKEEKE